MEVSTTLVTVVVTVWSVTVCSTMTVFVNVTVNDVEVDVVTTVDVLVRTAAVLVVVVGWTGKCFVQKLCALEFVEM